MSLTSSLSIGRSALNASQVAIQVTGNNFANASTPGYSRQVVSLIPSGEQSYGSYFLGRGVGINGITRRVDQGLQGRLWNGYSQESASGASHSTTRRSMSESGPSVPSATEPNKTTFSGSNALTMTLTRSGTHSRKERPAHTARLSRTA